MYLKNNYIKYRYTNRNGKILKKQTIQRNEGKV